MVRKRFVRESSEYGRSLKTAPVDASIHAVLRPLRLSGSSGSAYCTAYASPGSCGRLMIEIRLCGTRSCMTRCTSPMEIRGPEVLLDRGGVSSVLSGAEENMWTTFVNTDGVARYTPVKPMIRKIT